MKITKKLIFGVLLCSLTFICLSISVYAEDFIALIQKNNAEATFGYTRWVEKFEKEGSYSKPVYPDEYGGSYIDDNGKLVVLYVNDDTTSKLTRKNDLCKATGIQDVKIDSVEYSYNDLLNTSDIIGDFILNQYENQSTLKRLNEKENTMIDVEVVQSAIDTKNNTVVVWMSDISDEAIEAFRKNISDEPYLTFKLAEGRPVLEASYRSEGGWVNGDGVNSGASIGFPEKYGELSGFVTAYHCTNSGTNTINETER